MTCEDCAHFLCPLRDQGIVNCRNFLSYDILRRTERDTPSNEARIRGITG